MVPKVLLQAFYKRGKFVALPCPADPRDGPGTDWWWDHLSRQAQQLSQAGFTSLWLPPVQKAEQGVGEAALGYSVFDDYDIGSKDQKGTVHTRYGDREQLTRCAAVLRANGLEVYLDLQLNHRKGGSGPDTMTFAYVNAQGTAASGRFPKNRQCFHSRYPAGAIPETFRPEIPQDTNVPDGVGELQEGSKVYFGPDLAPINGKPEGYVLNGLVDSVDWVSRALDVQGYRLDHVQGISADFLKELLGLGHMQGKFAVGEYWDGVVSHVNDWVSQRRWLNGRSSAFDFPLYFTLLAMSNDPSFDMATLDHAGLAGVNPMHAVTFVENHDTESRRDLVPRNIQPEDKPLAYAYILTSEGFPCVFYKDYSTDPGCLGDRLQGIITNLVWIHQNIAEGETQQRWKDATVFVYERMGGAHLLVALNRDKAHSRTIQGIFTGFGPNKTLHDYSGHAGDIVTDDEGRITLTVPQNGGGLGYVCYSVSGIEGTFQPTLSAVTQVFEGAKDLDIGPADSQALRVSRLWVEANSVVSLSPTFDVAGWTADTQVRLWVTDTAGTTIGSKNYGVGSAIEAFVVRSTSAGWYALNIRADNVPQAQEAVPYKIAVTYLAPRNLPPTT